MEEQSPRTRHGGGASISSKALTGARIDRWLIRNNVHSVPAGACVLGVLSFLFPNAEFEARVSIKDSLRRVDWLGLILSVGASVVLIIPLQEGGSDFSWRSASVIAMVAVGGLCWVAFAGWEVFISRKPREPALLPMMPNRVAYQRVVGVCILYVRGTDTIFTTIKLTGNGQERLPHGYRFHKHSDLSPTTLPSSQWPFPHNSRHPDLPGPRRLGLRRHYIRVHPEQEESLLVCDDCWDSPPAHWLRTTFFAPNKCCSAAYRLRIPGSTRVRTRHHPHRIFCIGQNRSCARRHRYVQRRQH